MGVQTIRIIESLCYHRGIHSLNRIKMRNSRWRPRNGCDGRLIAKFLITTIQVNLCCLLRISLRFGIKFVINLPSQPFLSCHLGSRIFFHNGLLGGSTLFFYSWAVFGIDFTSLFAIPCCKAGIMPL